MFEKTASWKRKALIRRSLLMLLTVVPSVFVAFVTHEHIQNTVGKFLEISLCVLFAILFSWILIGFYSAFAGFVICLKRHTRKFAPMTKTPRTALLFPIYNEEVTSVFANIACTWRSLTATGKSDAFDLYVLSDTTDPDCRIAEETLWRETCRREHLQGRLYYRHRARNTERKSGNITDWCRKWGSLYEFMIVFDADSLLTGNAILSMVSKMVATPKVGILQTLPKIFNGKTFAARSQQFCAHLMGPIFATGIAYWQMGQAQYWGHNAIIRVEPFMRHCRIPILKGKPPLGGEIFSHDIVESAFMVRAGYEVWLDATIDGSYEQTPPTLIDELTRARRWCQGNLQHAKLLTLPKLPFFNRMLLVNGILMYASALLWLIYLLASSSQAFLETFIFPHYFPQGVALFPTIPRENTDWSLTILFATLAILFVPKLFGYLFVLTGKERKLYGGAASLTVSALLELVYSTLTAPIRMLSFSQFILGTLFGFGIGWNSQNRENASDWAQAFRFHWGQTVIGIVWGLLMWRINPGFFYWLSPIVVGLVLSIPISVLSSRKGFRALFKTPSETMTPAIISETNALRQKLRETATLGFKEALRDQKTHALHRALFVHHRRMNEKSDAVLIEKALSLGPDFLSRAEKNRILECEELFETLHRKLWTVTDDKKAARWGL